MEEIISPHVRVDVRGLVCPYTFVKAKLAVEYAQIGNVLEIMTDSEDAAGNIPRSMEELGHRVLKAGKTGDTDWVILVRKEKD